MTNERAIQIQRLFSENGPILRTNQLRIHGICSKDIQALLSANRVIRIKHGYYAWQDQLHNLTDNQIATTVIPNATLYFLSAAEIYGLTTVIPDKVYIAVPNVGKRPTLPDFPPIEITQFKDPLFQLGRTEIATDQGVFPIYSPERTVCDFMKNPDIVEKDVTLEVIRSYMQGPKNIQTLYEYADKMRVRHKLHPYVEVLL